MLARKRAHRRCERGTRDRVERAITQHFGLDDSGHRQPWRSDSAVSSTGELSSVNTTTGALTTATTLDYFIGAPLDSMEYVGTTLVGIASNGYYGISTSQPIYGESLVVIDPAATADKVGIAFELPAQVGAESWVSGLALAPTTLAIARQLDRAKWKQPTHSSR